MQPSQRARPAVPDFPELLLLDQQARDADEAREIERERHIAELRAAAEPRAAAQRREESERPQRERLALQRNTKLLFEALKSLEVPPWIEVVHFDVEFNACNFETPFERDDFQISLENLVTRFLEKRLVPALHFSMVQSEGEGVRWSVKKKKVEAAEIDKKQISQRQVVHLSRSEQTGRITGMCSIQMPCYFDEELGQMRSMDPVKFELTPTESERPNRPRPFREDQRYKKSDFDLREPVKPAFFAGDFYCMQNKEMIRVKGPKYGLRNETVYFSVETFDDNMPEDDEKSTPTSVVGFHVWDEKHVLLIAQLKIGTKIFMINVETRNAHMQILNYIQVIQSQVVFTASDRKKHLFLFNGLVIMEYERGPAGFKELAPYEYAPPFNFLQRGKCFCIQQGALCIGFDSFVAFYNFDQIKRRISRHEADDRVWKDNCYFYVTCNKPRDIIFVTPDSTKRVLVSSADGVQMWAITLARRV